LPALLSLARTYAAAGLRAKAKAALEQARKLSKRQEILPARIASVYARLGEIDRALDWFEKAYDRRDPYMVFLNANPALDPLRSERRFQDLVRRMNLPASQP
jgi:tetratricopeptide (TPR) repeat protein